MAFQRLFYDLQFGKKAASTRALTKAFGWTSSETYQQQDGHEFLSIVLDNLDSKMKGTQAEGTVDKLFKGKQTSYCRCINVDYEYTLDEEFRDIRVVVQDNKNRKSFHIKLLLLIEISVLEALDMYVRPQLLDDLYDAEEHGMQEAEQGVRFISFPPVLNIQLMRFNNDNYGMPYKVNDEYVFIR
jgi:ubiquitin carboxyl-terminal hydrolase 7